MSDYYDYHEKRAAPKPAYPATTPKSVKLPPREQPTKPDPAMMVEESIASETMIARVKAFWQK
jgi:hypothetical protein